MNALGAIQLRDNKEKAAWESAMQGLDSVGNLDTLLKDRYLTDGSTRPGVLGGSWWKPWSPEQAAAAEPAEPAKSKEEMEAEAQAYRNAFMPLDLNPQLSGLPHDKPGQTVKPEQDPRQQAQAANREGYEDRKSFKSDSVEPEAPNQPETQAQPTELAKIYDQTDGWRGAMGLPPVQRKAELADIHRQAKIRGLNHDQVTIDEKTSRPERDRQFGLANEKMEQAERLAEINQRSQVYTPEQKQLIDAKQQNRIAWDTAMRAYDTAAGRGDRENMAYWKTQADALKANDVRLNDQLASLGTLGYSSASSTDADAGAQSGNAAGLRDFTTPEHVQFVNSFPVTSKKASIPSRSDLLAKAESMGFKMSDAQADKVIDELTGKVSRIQEDEDRTRKKRIEKGDDLDKEGARSQAISEMRSLSESYGKFIANQTFGNYQMLAKHIGNIPADNKKSILQSLPGGVGDLFDAFQNSSVTKENFEKTKEAAVGIAKQKKAGIDSYLKTVQPKKKADL